MIHRYQRHIEFKASDGFELDGLLLPRNYEHESELFNNPIRIIVHGELGHFLSQGTPRILPKYLYGRGISSFSINTRMANIGRVKENVYLMMR